VIGTDWPGAGVVDLWWLDPSALSSAERSTLHRCLSADEQRRAHESPALTDELVAGRGLLRWALGRYLRVDPSTLRFDECIGGKPRLAGPAAEKLCFNLSHTRGLVVCGVARTELGIDVEYARRPAPLGVARHYFSEREQAALRAFGPGASQHFYKYWTTKEACVKGLGVGLTALRGVECEVDGPRMCLKLGGAAPPVPWSVVTWRATRAHQLAVVLAGCSQLALRFRSHGLPRPELRSPAAAPRALTAFTDELVPLAAEEALAPSA
jgi:4'-phosphopantetheinyl transferase